MPRIGDVFNPYKLFTGIWIPNGVLKCPELSAGAKLCLGRLYQYAGKAGIADPHQEELADELGVSLRQAQSYLSELVKKEFLVATRRGLGDTNTYEFLWHPCYEPDGAGEPRGASHPDTQDTAAQNTQDTAGPTISSRDSLVGTYARAETSDQEARIDRFCYETAAAAGKQCSVFSGSERKYLIQASSPELRETISEAIHATAALEVSGVVLRAAGFLPGRQRGPAGFVARKTPVASYAPPQRPRRATTAELIERCNKVKLT